MDVLPNPVMEYPRIYPAHLAQTPDMVDWCYDMAMADMPWNKTPLIRFNVGFYQIWQHYTWKGSGQLPEYEALASGVIHFLAAGKMLGLCSECHLPVDVNAYPDVKELDAEVLLCLCSRIVQQFWYQMALVHNWGRGSRYDKNMLEKDLAELTRLCIGYIPKSQRAAAIETAMKMVAEKEYKK